MIRQPPNSPLFPYPPLSRPPRRVLRDMAQESLAAEPPIPIQSPAEQTHFMVGEGLMQRRAGDLHDFKARRAFEDAVRSEEHTSELQSQSNLVCRLLLEKKKI